MFWEIVRQGISRSFCSMKPTCALFEGRNGMIVVNFGSVACGGSIWLTGIVPGLPSGPRALSGPLSTYETK